jgi:hypothetical protein
MGQFAAALSSMFELGVSVFILTNQFGPSGLVQIKSMVDNEADTSDYWLAIGQLMAQLDGMLLGYNTFRCRAFFIVALFFTSLVTGYFLLYFFNGQ